MIKRIERDGLMTARFFSENTSCGFLWIILNPRHH